MLNIAKLEDILGYKISKTNLYLQAFTHSSYSHDHHVDNYERLEFVGDSLLNFYVAKYLFEHRNEEVGVLSKMRASLVSTDNLVGIAKHLGLDECVLLSSSMKNNHNMHKVYADIIESLIACIYLDKGSVTCENFVQKYIIQSETNVQTHASFNIDYKTILQEKLQRQLSSPKIEYVCLKVEGTSNEPKFLMELIIDGERQTSAWGSSKKQAEQKCAKLALEKYHSEGKIEL